MATFSKAVDPLESTMFVCVCVAPSLILYPGHVFVVSVVLPSQLFSNLLPRLGPPRCLTTPWLLLLFDMTRSPDKAGEEGAEQINFPFN